MTSIDKIEKVVKILEKTGRLRKTDLAHRLMDEGNMAYDTANNAIDESVELGKVIREERLRKKAKIVWFTVHKDIAENEKESLESMKKRLKEFDNRFKYVKDAFPVLSYEEKANGLDSFAFLIIHLWTAVETLWINFGQTNEWKTLVDEVRDRIPPINELMLSASEEESLSLRGHIMNSKLEVIDDLFNQQDFFLHEIRRKYQNH